MYKNLLKKCYFRICGTDRRFFHPEKYPKVSINRIRYFRFKESENILLIIEGFVQLSEGKRLTEFIVKSDHAEYGSLMPYLAENKQADEERDYSNYTFSHYAIIRETEKALRIVSKKNRSTYCSFNITKKDILPYPFPEDDILLSKAAIDHRLHQEEENLKTLIKKAIRPKKVFLLTHNLNIEGAPKMIIEIAKGLARMDGFIPVIVSPEDGLLRPEIESHGVSVILLTAKKKKLDFHITKEYLCHRRYLSLFKIIESEKPDIVFVNTIECGDAVNICDALNIPCVWMIHESSYLTEDQLNIRDSGFSGMYKAFMCATRIVFCSSQTMNLYHKLNFRNNYSVVHNAISNVTPQENIGNNARIDARKRLNIPDNVIMLLNVGSINKNKNQELIIKALKHLKAHDIALFIVGARPRELYQIKLLTLINMYGLNKRVSIVPQCSEISDYYLAADIFLLPSISESYPLVILEAMMYGLPVLATKAFGINEQVEFGGNAIPVLPYDEKDLSKKIESLILDRVKGKQMGVRSRELFDKMLAYEEMIQAHAQVISSAWHEYNKQPRRKL